MACRPFLDAGVHATAGSDFSPGPFAPLMGMQGMVTRKGWDGKTWGANQRITVDEALQVNTINGAYASFEEGTKGSITAGKLAAFVVLAETRTQSIQKKSKIFRSCARSSAEPPCISRNVGVPLSAERPYFLRVVQVRPADRRGRGGCSRRRSVSVNRFVCCAIRSIACASFFTSCESVVRAPGRRRVATLAVLHGFGASMDQFLDGRAFSSRRSRK